MSKVKIFVAESISPEDFYWRRWEGYVVEEIVRLLGGRTSYKIVLNASLLSKAICSASKNQYDIFHLSCHGDAGGITLTDNTDISWEQLADLFQQADHMPSALILSSCLAGDVGVTRAFRQRPRRPRVIFGAEAEGKDVLTFPGACISWPVLYTELVKHGMARQVFMDALNKMNAITSHQFAYRRWDDNKQQYVRYPPRR